MKNTNKNYKKLSFKLNVRALSIFYWVVIRNREGHYKNVDFVLIKYVNKNDNYRYYREREREFPNSNCSALYQKKKFTMFYNIDDKRG